MKRLIIATITLLLSMAACKRDAAAPAAVYDPAPETTAAATLAEDAHSAVLISEADHASAPAYLDMNAFAGNFNGDDIALELNADGSYTLSGAAVSAPIDGTWTVEENGKRIRLDPNSKSEEDWLFGVTSNDALQVLDSAGNPPSNGAGELTRAE